MAWAIWPPASPSFEGVSLETWIEQYAGFDLDNPDSAETKRAREAISATGTNAIPFLLKWLNYEERPWRKRAQHAIINVPLGGFLYVMLSKPDSRAREAEHAFKALQTCGSNAVPALITLLTNPDEPATAMRASAALAYLGKPALPAILSTLTNGLLPNRDLAAHAIAYMDNSSLGDEGNSAVPILLGLLDNSDTELADTAALALGELGLQPTNVVPALTLMLTNPEPELRKRAALSLGAFKKNAAPAIPALLTVRSESDFEVRFAAELALFRIDPSSFPDPNKQ